MVIWAILAVFVLILIIAGVMKGRPLPGRLRQSEKDDD
jgi:hypothetical protein